MPEELVRLAQPAPFPTSPSLQTPPTHRSCGDRAVTFSQPSPSVFFVVSSNAYDEQRLPAPVEQLPLPQPPSGPPLVEHSPTATQNFQKHHKNLFRCSLHTPHIGRLQEAHDTQDFFRNNENTSQALFFLSPEYEDKQYDDFLQIWIFP